MWLIPTEGSEATRTNEDLFRLGEVFSIAEQRKGKERKKNMSLTDRLYAVAKPIWEGYLEQPFVKDDKHTVGEVLTQKIATIGEKIEIKRFVRYAVGE